MSTNLNYSTYSYDFLINEYLVGEYTDMVYGNLSDFGNWAVDSEFDIFLTKMRVNFPDSNYWYIESERAVTILDGNKKITYEYSSFGILMNIITVIDEEVVLKIEKEVPSNIDGIPIFPLVIVGSFAIIYISKKRNTTS